MQEALARAWERSDRGERIDSLKAWVMVVSLNLTRSGLRRLRAERRARQRIAPDVTRVDLEAGERVDLQRALSGLPRRHREAIVLRYYLDLDVREIAFALHVPEGTVKSDLYRARTSLARALGDHDLEEVTGRDEA